MLLLDLLPPDRNPGQGAVARHRGQMQKIVHSFLNEARSLARLTHPNIVGVHQVFEDNDTAYMAMDYIRGHDLLEIIEEKRGG